MQAVIDDFNLRKAEIEKYFDFIGKIENDIRYLSKKDGTEGIFLDDEHFKIFKANGFLILYNLIESTIVNCIVSIFDEISTKKRNSIRISYTDVTEEIKKYWLKSKYNHDEKIKKESVVNQFFIICEKITKNIAIGMERQGIGGLGGSLDALKIREVALDLGIILKNCEPPRKEYLHGEALLKIKQHRNHLAHGEMSFSTIGRDVTYFGDREDGIKGLGLDHFKKYTFEHLESFITDISEYINEERYLVVKPTIS